MDKLTNLTKIFPTHYLIQKGVWESGESLPNRSIRGRSNTNNSISHGNNFGPEAAVVHRMTVLPLFHISVIMVHMFAILRTINPIVFFARYYVRLINLRKGDLFYGLSVYYGNVIS